MFACLECGKKFRTAKAALRASNHGCPKCGGSDIDLAPAGASRSFRALTFAVNDMSNDPTKGASRLPKGL
jgi:predicted  nucleic acid-binding Zn-ribbon protein